MFILRITVPVDNHLRDGVFDWRLYFQCKKSPTKEQVVNTLRKKLDESFCGMNHGLEEVISVINLMDDWCWVNPNGVVMTNTFVNHPKWGTRPVSFDIINPEIIE